MFEQRDRWLEELIEYTRREESITCTSGHMPLIAILQEIADACADPQPHDRSQFYDWQSRSADLTDTLDWIGPQLSALVDAPGRAIVQAITNGLLTLDAKGRICLDDTQRPVVGAATAALMTIIGRDDMLLAAWRDLVGACRDTDHIRYPHERVAFLRDTVVALSEYRKQGRGFWAPISKAANVLGAYQGSVWTAQLMIGEPQELTVPFNPQERSTLSSADLEDLAERCLLAAPAAGEFVVWFRLAPAFVHNRSCVTHGDITFYDAQRLAKCPSR